MTDLPSSLPEKLKSWEDNRYIEHWMYVHELRALLDELKPDDWLTPNEVHNLLIGRDGRDGYGVISFSHNEIEVFSQEEEQSDGREAD